MKKGKLMMTALLGSLLVASSVFAAGSGNGSNKAKSAENYVRIQLAEALSDVANTSAGLVSIYFDVNSKGGFKLLNVTGADNNLVENVKSALSHVSINTAKVLEGQYMVKIYLNSNETASIVSPVDALRDQISVALASVNADKEGKVKITFMAKEGKFEVKNVEGDDKLASVVKSALSINTISVPSELSGLYQLNVRF
jgi:hypothetical protein